MDVLACLLYHKDAYSKPRKRTCVLTRTDKKRKGETNK